MNKILLFILLSIFLFTLSFCKRDQPKEVYIITHLTLEDKIAGGWAGKMIGVTYGAPTEFRALQRINTDSIKWKPEDIKGSIWQDDLYVQLTFLMAMDSFGIDAPAKKFQEMLAKADYPLWCANMQARKNFHDSIFPPASGSPANNFRADDIDFQIEADYIGFMNPGMIQNVVEMTKKIGHIMNYGDGVYGGIFLPAMYSAAFFEKDVTKVIEKALSTIPPESDYARIVRDVIILHNHYPNDWRSAWKELDAKWGSVDISGAGSPFNIDAKINGAYIVLGLLYGDGDVYKTLEITTRCGQDSDCNPSSALAVLGVMKGFSQLPPEMRRGVKAIEDSVFINTNYSFKKAVKSTCKYAMKLIHESGGVDKSSYITIPWQLIVRPKVEASFPNVVYDKSHSVFKEGNWKFKGKWQVYHEKSSHGIAGKKQAKVTSSKGSEAEITFNGTGIAIFGNWFRNGGIADVYLDGKLNRTIDTYYFYAQQTHPDVCLWHIFQLQPGKHVVKIVVRGEKRKESLGAKIYLCQAVIYQTAPKVSDKYRFSFEHEKGERDFTDKFYLE